jgi:hypothetical protein
MEQRRAPLPPDLLYFIDGAIEAWEIGAFAYDTISLFGDTETVDNITGGGTRTGPWKHARQARCDELDAYAHEIAASLGEPWQRALMAASIPYEIKLIYDVAEIIADWNYEDQIIGGAQLPWRKVRRCDDDFEPTKGLKRHLYAPSAIHRYTKARCLDEFAHATRIIGRLRNIPWPVTLSEGRMIVEAREAALVRNRDLIQRQVADMLRDRRGKVKAIQKPERKKLIRAASIASAVVGEEKVRRFIAGSAVEIEGDTMILEARPRGSLTRGNGHSQLEVTVKNKDRVKLGNLCVYFDGTAALDQLAALALHVGSGNEADILNTGNLYSVTADGATDPILSNFMRKQEALARRQPLDSDRRQSARLRYFANTGPVYIDAVAVHLWGRDADQEPLLRL